MKKKILLTCFLIILIIFSAYAMENNTTSVFSCANSGNNNNTLIKSLWGWFIHSYSAAGGVLGLAFGVIVRYVDMYLTKYKQEGE